MKNDLVLTVLLACCLSFSVTGQAVAAVPPMINYQGRLTNAGGFPVDTTVAMTFTIYADSNGVSPVWSETQTSVPVSGGLFSVLLGSVTPIGDNVFDGTERWLGIQVGVAPPAAKPIPIVSVAYAHHSWLCDTARYAPSSGNGWLDDGGIVRLVDGTDSVGIGNSSPTTKFHVGSAPSAKQVAQFEGLTLVRTNGAGQPVTLKLMNLNGSANSGVSIDLEGLNASSGSKGAGRISAFLTDQTALHEKTALTFYTGDYADDGLVERVRIDEDGDVGIGKTNPAQKLDVNGTAQVTGFKLPTGAINGYVLTSDAGGAGSWQPAAGGNSYWNLRVTETADTTLVTNGRWGIARAGNDLYGNKDSTHVNLGVSSATGTDGLNWKYCTVGGGWSNHAAHQYSTVSGGYHNSALGMGAVVGGGYHNVADGFYAMIAGGIYDSTDDRAYYATIGGGIHNVTIDTAATIGGGKDNRVYGEYGVIGGGLGNVVQSIASGVLSGRANSAGVLWGDSGAVVCGGVENDAGGMYSSIMGGRDNGTTYESRFSTIGGGSHNRAEQAFTVIGGGFDNFANHQYATIGGGSQNNIQGDFGAIGGGANNVIQYPVLHATIAGGHYNKVSGNYGAVAGGKDNDAAGEYAFVGGGRGNIASGMYASIPGGMWDTVAGSYSMAAGLGVNVSDTADYTFAFGRAFNTSAANAVIFHNSVDPIKMGVGTTNPKAQLEVGEMMRVLGQNYPSYPDTGKGLEIAYNPSNNTGLIQVYDRDTDTWGKLYLGSGDVGIGTSNPTQKLDVNGTARLRGIAGGSGTTVVADANGVLYKSTSSDRYKTNISKLDADGEKVLQLEPVRFQWRTTGGKDIGLIAEEVDKTISDLVIYDQEGKPEAVKYDKITLYLLELAKSQQSLIRTQQGEIDALKARLERVEEQMPR